MQSDGFEWDDDKAATNAAKHGVTFEDAQSVFIHDPAAREAYDPDHSAGEDRYLLVGWSAGGQLLVVCFTDRNGHIRIISARELTRREEDGYVSGNFP